MSLNCESSWKSNFKRGNAQNPHSASLVKSSKNILSLEKDENVNQVKLQNKASLDFGPRGKLDVSTML